MRYAKLLLRSGFVLFWAVTAHALYIDQGIHGMKWGSSISDTDGMVEVHEKNQAKFYLKASTQYYTADLEGARVSYGFYRDQLYAAFIKLRSVDQFSQLADTFSEKHGTARVSYEDAGKQIIFRWKVNDVKIKLKMKDSIGMYKLAFYYAPLADQLNQDQLEEVSNRIYGPDASAEGDPGQRLPLIDY